MQTMPARTRTAMTVGAILLGLVVVGALALYAANRGKTPTAQNSSDPYQTQEMAGTQTHDPMTAAPLTGAKAPADKGTTGTAPTGSMTPADNGTAATAPGAATALAQNGSTATMTGAQVPETYEVAAGESLRDIAMKFYGNPIYSADIEALNGIKDPDVIMAGQVLNLPRPEAVNH